MLSEEQRQKALLTIHEAIHQPNCNTVKIGKKILPIERLRNGSRYVRLGDVTVMEQDRTSNTSFAVRAKSGEHLSWVVPRDEGRDWRLLEGRTI